MTIATLKSKIAGYLQRAVADYSVNGVDLLLDAINKAHQWGQQQYDFEYAKCVVDALVSLEDGVAISPLPLHGTMTNVAVKKVLKAFVSDAFKGFRPIKFVSRAWQTDDVEQRWSGIPYPFAPSQRDMPSYPTFFETYLVQVGQTLMIYPNATIISRQDPLPISLDVVQYFPDYIDDSHPVDFFLQYGDDWLAWDAICRLNVLNKEFVPRQEGNIAPPTDQRDRAWQDLLAWDAQLVTTGDSMLSLD